MKRGKKGQSANEAALIIIFLTFLMIVAIAAVSDDIIQASDNNYKALLQDIADVIESEANIAFASENGYTHSFTLPQTLNGQPYAISIINSMQIGDQANTTILSVASTRPNVHLNVTRLLPKDVLGSLVIGPNTVGKEQGILILMALPSFEILSANPSSGPVAGGTVVSITGSDFGATVSVSFGGASASVTSSDSNTINVVTPAHAAGAVDVVVTNPDNQFGILSNGFTYVLPPPTVSAADPSGGTTGGGTSVTVSGTGFVSGAVVAFGGVASPSVTFVSSTSLTAVTPAHAAGAVDVVVTNPDLQFGTLVNGFTYVAPPTVTSFSPGIGPSSGDTTVTITGSNFVATPSVTFGGASASVTFVSSTSLTAVTPAHAVGYVTVTVTNTDGQSANAPSQFLYRISPVAIGTVFVTSLTYNGNLGGLSGADDKCQARADAGSFGGTWKAWVSTSMVDANTRVTDTTYRRLDDVLVANSLADLTDGSIANRINVANDGAAVSENVWTGTLPDGTRSSSCTDWTSSDGVSQFALIGFTTSTGGGWTYKSITTCNAQLRIYCFRTS